MIQGGNPRRFIISPQDGGDLSENRIVLHLDRRIDNPMKPKLIIINGALGVGKSTLAREYAEEHPLTLHLDIDELRKWISCFREEKEKSGLLSKNLAGEMARTHLSSGYDVVISQIFCREEYLERFEKIAEECQADFYEFLLSTSKDDALRRFIKRGQSEGYPDGFKPGGLVDLGGREKKLAELYDDMMRTISQRPSTKVIESIEGDIQGTYAKFLKNL